MDLEGLLVVSVEQAVAAPYASSRLADAGARVLKVERPEGDFARDYDRMVAGQSAYFVWLNRGKESICLDLKREADVQLLRRMTNRADVFIQNLKPGAMAKLGLAVTDLVAENPRLIACSISGFGEDGPYADKKAYDLIVQAEIGLCSITGSPDHPARVGVSICDIAAGMTAHSAILQSLYRRERTNCGRTIEVSLFDALADWMNVPYLQQAYGDFHTQRTGVNHPSLTPYGAYRVAGEHLIVFSVQNQREWRSFCTVVLGDRALADRAEFRSNTERLVHRVQLDCLIEERLATLTREEAEGLLDAAGIARGRLSSIADLAAHPHLRKMSVSTEAGEVHVIAPGARFPGSHPTSPGVPAKGAQTDEIRREFES